MRQTLRFDNRMMQRVGTVTPASIPASVKGWDAISSLADMPPDHAIQLDNWIPRPGYLEVRRGSVLQSGIVLSTATQIQSLMAYNPQDTTKTKLFAVGGNQIWDVSVATATAVVTGWGNSQLQHVNFANAANNWLVVCNGVNGPGIYNGSTWSTMSGGDTTYIQPAVWKGRLWFVKTGSSVVDYFPVGAIGGTAASFDLGSLMDKGGYVNAIGTWTIDTYQAVDEYIAFITSKGQVFVYQGTDPTTANTFALVGKYNLGEPIGRRCLLRISGNLWVITLSGVIPLTEMLAQDVSVAPKVAITSNIMNAINKATQNYSGNFGWQFISYPRGTLAVLNVPLAPGGQSHQYVMNTLTGAWCRFVGLDAQCWELWNNFLYFGSTDGRVYKFDVGSGDFTGDENVPIVAEVQTAFNYFDTRGWVKRFTALRPLINTDTDAASPGVGLNVDFGQGGSISVPSTISSESAQWDIAQWDVASWPVQSGIIAHWTSVAGIGQCASILTRLTTSYNGTTDGVVVQLNGWDITMERGSGFY